MKDFVILCRIFIESNFAVVTTMEQLNLFNIEEDNFEKKMDAKETVSPNSVEHKAEETHTVQAPSLKDDSNKSCSSDQETTRFQVMDKVKVVLISEELDSETHNYRKYYEPYLIGKIGEITNIIVSTKGKVTYEVDVYGEKSIFEEAELLWIG